MNEPPATRASLLVRLRDAADQEAWRQFVQLYGPLLYRHGRRHGLQDADAADLAQDVLHAVSRSVARLDYDPARGSFRGWLLTVAHRKLCDWLTRRRRQVQGTGDSAAQEQLNELPAADEERWNQDYEQQVFARAAEQVRDGFEDATWLAFWRTAVEGKAVKDVAEELGMSVGAVYIARSRVQARLRDEVRKLQVE